jgi:hypothetical protein
VEKVELAFALILSVFYGFLGVAIYSAIRRMISNSGQAVHRKYPKHPKHCKLHRWEYEHNWLICQDCGFISGSEGGNDNL